jgi:hypothetical protein
MNGHNLPDEHDPGVPNPLFSHAYQRWIDIFMTEGIPAQQQLFGFEQDAGCLELLIRIVYGILIGIVLGVYSIIAFVCLIIQWFHILIPGQRNERLSNLVKGYLEDRVHVMNYMYIITDKRPDILPVTVKIFEEV